jgi:hypothetical protein
MSVTKPRPTRTLQLMLAWAVGVIGTITTAMSVIPAVAVAVLVYRGPSLRFALPLFVAAALYLSVPTLIALTIADTARRWWLWLTVAIAVVVLLLLARPAIGSLGVYWLAL